MRRHFLILASTALLAACAGTPTLPSAPQRLPNTDLAYRLNSGDEMEINVWRNPEVSTKVPIRPDGRVTIPLIEDLQAAGKTPAQLAREIEAGLSKYIREPSVSVIVTKFADNMRDQVRVAGEVTKPAALPYKAKMTLLDAVLGAGGLTKIAAGNRAVLVRPSDNNKMYSVRIKDLLSEGDSTANVELMPGDVITVPSAVF